MQYCNYMVNSIFELYLQICCKICKVRMRKQAIVVTKVKINIDTWV